MDLKDIHLLIDLNMQCRILSQQMLPLKLNKDKFPVRPPARSPTPGSTPLGSSHPSTDSLLSLAAVDCTVVAAKSVGGMHARVVRQASVLSLFFYKYFSSYTVY